MAAFKWLGWGQSNNRCEPFETDAPASRWSVNRTSRFLELAQR